MDRTSPTWSTGVPIAHVEQICPVGGDSAERWWRRQLLADPGTLAAAARLLLDLHFTPGLAAMICDAVGLDLAVLELAANPAVAAATRSPRRPGFAEEVLRAYAYQCAMCGFDGALGRNPVRLEAAHVRWHSQDGPTWWPTAWLCARCTMPCSTWA